MSATPPRASKEDVTFWLPDPADINRLMKLLEICGYTDEILAREEASQIDDSCAVFEVTVRRRETVMPQPWPKEITWVQDTPKDAWQA